MPMCLCFCLSKALSALTAMVNLELSKSEIYRIYWDAVDGVSGKRGVGCYGLRWEVS